MSTFIIGPYSYCVETSKLPAGHKIGLCCISDALLLLFCFVLFFFYGTSKGKKATRVDKCVHWSDV